MPISTTLKNAIANQETRVVETDPGSTKNSDSPDFIGHAARSEAPAMKIVRDVFEGTLKLREEGATYLPRFPREDRQAWRERKNTAVLFNAYRRTVKGLAGMVFRKDPVLGDDVPDEIADHLKNVDLSGRDLATFARDTFEDAMIDGHAGVFVDFSRTADEEMRTRFEERTSGVRPYWCAVAKSAVISFRSDVIDGRPVLTQVAWVEGSVEPLGDFGEKLVRRIRVHTLKDGGVRMRLFEEAGNGKWNVVRELPLALGEIPFVPIYTNRTGFWRSSPPLLDLALENIRHYQLRSDRDNTLHIAGVPVPVFTGLSDETATINVGPTSGVTLPPDGEAFYLEPNGAALDSSRDELQDIERRMATQGLSMLQSETRAAETAMSKRIDKSESDSQLAASARGLEHSLNEALRLHARWMGLDDGGSVSVNRDFEAQPMDARMVDVLARLVEGSQLSIESLWESLIAGEILPGGFDPELERERIGEQSIAGLETFIRAQQRGDVEAA